MNVVKIEVPKNTLSMKRLEKVRAALEALGIPEYEHVTVVATDTRLRFTARVYSGY